MRAPITETPEARALWYFLHIIGEAGREELKRQMMDRASDGDAEANNLLNRVNDFERAKGQVARMKREGKL